MERQRRVADLVERSGFEPFKSGWSIFERSILVYLAGETDDSWPNTDITDHTGSALGFVRRTAAPAMRSIYSDFSVYDVRGKEVLKLTAEPRMGDLRYDIDGTVRGRYEALRKTWLTIEADGSAIGYISSVISYYSAPDLSRGETRVIQSEHKSTVGVIKSYEVENSMFGHRYDSVMWVDPTADASLRALLTAAPPIIASARINPTGIMIRP